MILGGVQLKNKHDKFSMLNTIDNAVIAAANTAFTVSTLQRDASIKVWVAGELTDRLEQTTSSRLVKPLNRFRRQSSKVIGCDNQRFSTPSSHTTSS
jgi:hypothetical protein